MAAPSEEPVQLPAAEGKEDDEHEVSLSPTASAQRRTSAAVAGRRVGPGSEEEERDCKGVL